MIIYPTHSFMARTGFEFTIGEDSLARTGLQLVSNHLAGGEPESDYAYSQYKRAISWAEDVRRLAYAQADTIHNLLMGASIPGALSLCSSAFADKYAYESKYIYTFGCHSISRRPK